MSEEKPFKMVAGYFEFEEFEEQVCKMLERGYCILGEPHYHSKSQNDNGCYYHCFFIKETFMLKVKKALINGQET